MLVENKRIKWIDITKGIGIVLMILGHSGFPFTSYIYLFHMPLFFILSGYLFQGAKLSTFHDLLQYIRRKLWHLYMPFVVYNVVSICATNIFIALHFIEGPIWSLREIICYLPLVLIGSGGSQLMGAAWFYIVLLKVMLVYGFLEFILNRLHRNVFVWQTIIAIFFLCVGFGLQRVNFNFFALGTTLTVYCFIQLGRLLHAISLAKRKCIKYFVPFCILALLWLNRFGSVNIASNRYPNPITLVFGALDGFLLVLNIALLLEKTCLYKGIAYIGRNSGIFVFMHFIAFKFVSLVEICVYHWDIEKLCAFPTLYCENGWWIGYFIIGMTIPLIIKVILCLNKILRNKLKLDLYGKPI